jgi:hypothetical protein
MANRFNQTNTAGVVTASAGAMPANNFTNKHAVLSRVNNGVAAVTVRGSGNAVEVGGDGGLYDTVAGSPVNRENTNFGCINV